MKKQCKGCYAADTGSHPMYGDAHGCKLGYATDGNGHPQEECPKPKSWRKFYGCHPKYKVKIEKEIEEVGEDDNKV